VPDIKRSLIIVPAYNESQSIGQVIRVLSSLSHLDVVIINDGSDDNTSALAKKTKNTSVIDHPLNLGIGAAVQTGFMYALENGYQYALQFDGDGQHLETEIDKILTPLFENKADVVIGSRFIEKKEGYQSTFLRRFGIKIFKCLSQLIIGKSITDCTSGFRAYNHKAIKFLAYHYPEDFPEPEAVILLGKNNFKIKEVPVKMKAREHGASSIGGVKSLYYMIKVMLAMLINGFRKPIRLHGEPEL